MSVSRITIRMVPTLLASLEERARQDRRTTAELIRQVLEAWLDQPLRLSTPSRTTEEPTTPLVTLATLEARLAAVERWQTTADTRNHERQPVAVNDRRIRQPTTASDRQRSTPRANRQTRVSPLDYDPAKHVLGKLCPQRHDYQASGHSILLRSNRCCVTCEQARAQRRKAKREAERQAQAATPGP